MLAVIPAAGLGSRFLPASRAVPKELLPLGTRPLIHHVLDEVERAGFDRAAVVVSPAKAAIRGYFEPDPALERVLRERGDGSGLAELREAAAIAGRLRLRFVEQPHPLGMGDAVARCRQLAPGEPLAVLLPDDVIAGSDHWTRLLALHAEQGAACLCVRAVPPESAHRFGIAVCAPDERGRLRVEGLVEKPRRGRAPSNLAVLGRYVITERVLDAIDEALVRPPANSEVQLTDGLAAVLAHPPGVLAVPFAGEVFDSGTPEEYARSLAAYMRVSGGRSRRTTRLPGASASDSGRERSSNGAASPGSPRGR